MCGIVGKFVMGEGEAALEELKLMADKIAHRGPDDEGFYLSPDKKTGLGHRRLSIIDLSTYGHQPMSNEDGTVWIVFNGEIYNFLELRDDLIKKGHRFRSQTDTEVILHLYEEKGEKCLQELKGMFAFVLYDQQRNLLFGARDRSGIKPLYYFQKGQAFYFSSEIKSFYGLSDFKKHLSYQAIYDFLTLRYIPWPQTPWLGVNKLGPGHYFIWQNRQFSVGRYSDFVFSESQEKVDWTKKFSELFLDSVKRHLMSDVPLGIFLSGGVDSAAVLAAMRELGVANIKTFSIGYDDPRFSELDDARAVADFFKTEHREKKMSPNDFWNYLEECVYFMDEPLADLAALPLYLIAQSAAQEVKVILSGEGADELFAGYTGFNLEYMYFTAFSLFDRSQKNHFLSHPQVMTNIMTDGQKRQFLNAPIASDLLSTDRLYNDLLVKNKDYHPINNKLSRLMRFWLPDDLLQKADKMTMAHSLELRVPFLYDDMINFAIGLPIQQKTRFGFSESAKKVIVKKFLTQYLPEKMVLKKKRGFGHPIYQWYLEDEKIRERVEQTIMKSPLLKEITQETVLAQIIESRQSQLIFNLFILAKWAKIHL